MSTVRLYIGTGPRWSETEVGRLVDATVEVGRGPSTIYPAHVDRDGTVFFGATWTYGPAQTVLGHVNERDHTVAEGLSRYGDTIGNWDEDGVVYGGPSYRREAVGRCDPPSGAGAACLLLLFANDAPHKDALVAAAQPGSTYYGLEVKRPKEKKHPDPGHKAAVAAGVATGVAAYGIERGITGWLRKHSGQTQGDTTHGAHPVHPHPPAQPAPSAPTQPAPETTKKPLWELVNEELLHPGTHIKNLTPVAGAITYLGTPEAELIPMDTFLPTPGEVLAGSVPAADAEVNRILAHMRTFVDHDTIDGEFGLASSWQKGYLDVQMIRDAYDNFLCLRDLVHIYAESPEVPPAAADRQEVRDRWPPAGKLPWEEPIQARRATTYIRLLEAHEEKFPGTHVINRTRVAGAVTRLATSELEIVQPDPTVPMHQPIYSGGNPRADMEAQRIFEHLRTFISAEGVDGDYGVAAGYTIRALTFDAVRETYGNMLNIRDLVHLYFTPALN